jgi:hypothetical protein
MFAAIVTVTAAGHDLDSSFGKAQSTNVSSDGHTNIGTR